MEPEISHRCETCGAAFRKGEQSCPQCGAKIGVSKTDEPLQDAPAAIKNSSVSESKRASRGSTAPTQPFKPEMRDLPFAADRRAEELETPAQTTDVPMPSTEAVSTSNESQSKTQRVKDAAREMVQENVRPRVERLRHASSVVLEEAAAIDPSLRFVLIAIFLFLVFMLLLVLSFVR